MRWRGSTLSTSPVACMTPCTTPCHPFILWHPPPPRPPAHFPNSLRPHNSFDHRVGRVLRFSLVVGIGTPPPPRLQASVPTSLWFRGGGGAHSLAREGVGEFYFIRGDIHFALGTLYILYMYFVLRPQNYCDPHLNAPLPHILSISDTFLYFFTFRETNVLYSINLLCFLLN